MQLLSGQTKTIKKASIYSLLIIGLLVAVAAPLTGKAHAASFGETFIRFDNLTTSAQTTGTVCVKPTTTATEASVAVVFPTGYTLGVVGTFTVNTTNLAWPTGGTVWPSIATATNVTSQTVTFPSGDLTVGTLYCFNWANSAAVKITASAGSTNSGSITTQTSTPTAIDSSTYTTDSLLGSTVTVNATVPQSFGLTLVNTTDNLGSLTTSGVATSSPGAIATVDTNAATGWMMWAQDANTGLHSNIAGVTIPSTSPGSNSTETGGTPGANLGVTGTQAGGSGTLSVATAFNGSTAAHGGGLNTALQLIASSNGTAQTAALTLKNNVAIGTLTPAATDYTDTETITAAAMF